MQEWADYLFPGGLHQDTSESAVAPLSALSPNDPEIQPII